MLTLILLILATSTAASDGPTRRDGPVDTKPQRVIDLRGKWDFQLGDDAAWADGKAWTTWETIFVPSQWENEGYPGYDGYAWYRKAFKLPPSARDKTLYLNLGKIDDTDEVYLNGHFLGSTGAMAPKAYTAYNQERRYRIPQEFLEYADENIVTVRVLDLRLEGGIVSGLIGVYAVSDPDDWSIDLAGAWKFSPGDDPNWRRPGFNDREWNTVTVPANWEPQGFRDLDGYAWYRKRFYLPKNASETEFSLKLGKIDDLDETFVNGVLVGRTGEIDREHIDGDEWQVLRHYPVPPGVLKAGSHNVVAVRVYDARIGGGIFEGPTGLYPSVEQADDPEDEAMFIQRFLNWLSG